MKIINPYNNEVVGKVKEFSRDKVKEAFERAAGYERPLNHLQRADFLNKVANTLRSRQKEFAETITSESGICIRSSIHEVERSVEILEESAKLCKSRVSLDDLLGNGDIDYDVFPEKTFELNKRKYIVFYEPAGVVSSITPFNHPLNQIVTDIAPAIAANNAIILKPSEKTPLTAVKFEELLKECGMPEGMVQVVTGNVSVIGDEMIQNSCIDMLSFTGGIKVGEYIARKSGIKKTCLELSGNGTLIICPDANLEKTVEVAINGAFGNSGQRCTGIKRILLFGAEKFVDLFVDRVKELKYGDPIDSENYIGTVINKNAARLIERRVKKAIKDGAKLLYGHKRKGAVYAPTVLDNVNPKSELVKKETFGPVAPIIRVKSLEEAIDIVNSTVYGLQSGIMTEDISNVLMASSRIKTGAVIMNDGPHCYRPQEIPFGGTKYSGHGRKGTLYGMLEMSNLKWLSVEK